MEIIYKLRMRVNVVLLLLFIVSNGWGQAFISTPEESAKKKEINSIKLEGDAYYSDKYHEVPADEAEIEEAHKRSKELLQAHVIEIFSKRLKMSREDVQEIWSVIEKNSQNIVVKRGDMFRVFTYVMKNAFGGGGGGEVSAPESILETVSERNNELADQVSAATQTVQVSEPKVDSVAVVSPVPEIYLPVSEPESKQVPVPEPKVDSVKVVMPVPEVSLPVSVPEPEPVSVPNPVPVASDVEIPLLCQTLISKGNFDAVYRYLKQEMTYQRLIYGPEKRMQYPEKCYIVLTDKVSGEIAAVLGKGQSERMNFVTKKMDHFKNYLGGNYKAIFVQEY